MSDVLRIEYTTLYDSQGESAQRPLLPGILIGAHNVAVTALIDSGSDVNVLPYEIGVQLGANWNQQTISVALSGNLARYEAKGLRVIAQVGNLGPVRLVFAWTEKSDIPVILGQTNFFDAFDICFFRSDGFFEVKRRT
jgi:hypothetical protein